MKKRLEFNKIRHSYSYKGMSYDHAGIDSFHASLSLKARNVHDGTNKLSPI